MTETKRKSSTPPKEYICSVCNQSGHWIQQCTQTRRKKRKKNPSHVHVPGVDPSQQDIDQAREMQKIKPPKCFCGQTSRLKKVKRSSAGDDSRAIGKYFFFCNKPKLDESKCRFARPVEDEIKPKKERICTFFAKNGFCKKGDKCMFSHDVQVKVNDIKKDNEGDKVDKGQKKQPEKRGRQEQEKINSVEDQVLEKDKTYSQKGYEEEGQSDESDTSDSSSTTSDSSSNSSDDNSSSEEKEIETEDNNVVSPESEEKVISKDSEAKKDNVKSSNADSSDSESSNSSSSSSNTSSPSSSSDSDED